MSNHNTTYRFHFLTHKHPVIIIYVVLTFVTAGTARRIRGVLQQLIDDG